MSTRSHISALCADSKFRTIYCHFDGYPSGVGAMLQEHYQDQAKIDGLLALGNLSSLEPSIEVPPGHTYDNKVAGHTVAYARDRRESWEDQQPGVGATYEESEQACRCGGDEYHYLWDGTKWHVRGTYEDDTAMRPLSEVLTDEAE